MNFLLILGLFTFSHTHVRSFNFSDCLLVNHGPCMVSRVVSEAYGEKSTVIVYEKSNEDSATVFSIMLGEDKHMLYEYRELNKFLGEYMKHLLEYVSVTEYSGHLNFILACGLQCIQTTLDIITELDNTIGRGSLLRHFSTWLIVSPDPPPKLDINLDNVAMIELGLPEMPPVLLPAHLTINNTKCCEEKRNLLHCSPKIFTLFWMTEGRKWLRIHPCNVLDEHLYAWLFPNTLKGLNGRQVIVSTLEWPPYAQREGIDGNVIYAGAGFDVMDLLKTMFNFSYVVVEPPDNEWGRELEHGNWTGVIGMLQRHEADMCPVLYGMSKHRRRVVDFSTPLEATRFSAMYRRNIGETTSWLYLLTCFSWKVYVCGSVSTLWIVFLYEFVTKQRSVDCKSLARSFQVVIHAPFRQAIQKIPKNTSERIVLSTWYIFCLVMIAIFTSNLVAFATVDKYRPPFTTLEELAEQDDYGLGVYDGTYAKETIMNSNSSTYKALYKKFLKSNNDGQYSSDEAMRSRLTNENYVLLVSKEIENIIRSTTCEVETMKERFLPVHSGLIYQKNSPLRKLFDMQLVILKESGIYDKITLDWSPQPLKCPPPENVPKVEFNHLKAAMVTCGAGVLVAAVALLVEKNYSNSN